MRFRRKLKKCPHCKQNDFRIRECTVYGGKLNKETGRLDIETIVTNEIVDASCRNCGECLKVGKLEFEFLATE